eukprot:ctg_874.g425
MRQRRGTGGMSGKRTRTHSSADAMDKQGCCDCRSGEEVGIRAARYTLLCFRTGETPQDRLGRSHFSLSHAQEKPVLLEAAEKEACRAVRKYSSSAMQHSESASSKLRCYISPTVSVTPTLGGVNRPGRFGALLCLPRSSPL